MRTPQEIRDSVLDLLKKKDISVNKMLIECGYNTSLVADLKKGQMPSADKIAKIASFLGVSTDYLMGNENKSDFDLNQDNNNSDSEQKLIIALRRIFYGESSHKLNENDAKNITELLEVILRVKSDKNQERKNGN